MSGYEEAISQVIQGNLWLAVCCGVYLAWWSVAFNPWRDFPMPLKVVGFCVTAACGVWGVVLLAGGIGALPDDAIPVPGWAFWLIGAAVYGLLLFLTSRFFQRQVTTELLLIVGWATLELSAVNALADVGALVSVGIVIATVAVIVSAALGMGCYLAYYQLPAGPAFFAGMVPLILFGVAGIIVNVCIV